MSSKTQLPHLLLQERELPEHPLTAAHEAEPRQRGGAELRAKPFKGPTPLERQLNCRIWPKNRAEKPDSGHVWSISFTKS